MQAAFVVFCLSLPLLMSTASADRCNGPSEEKVTPTRYRCFYWSTRTSYYDLYKFGDCVNHFKGAEGRCEQGACVHGSAPVKHTDGTCFYRLHTTVYKDRKRYLKGDCSEYCRFQFKNVGFCDDGYCRCCASID